MALALAQRGFKLALIDVYTPQTTSADPERAIALSHGSCRFLDDLGVWSSIKRCGTGVIQHIAVCEPGTTGQVGIHHDELKLDALGHVIEMGDIVAPMLAAAQESMDLFYPATITDLHMDTESAQISLTHNSKNRQLSAHLIIAADGSHSPMRCRARIGSRGWPHNRFALVASIQCEHAHQNTAYECFQRSGPLALLPMADGRMSLVWALPADRAMQLLQMQQQDFLTQLQQAVQDTAATALGNMVDMGRRGSFPLELRIANQLSQHRLLLAGNAAHSIHPVAGQGMNLGFRDVTSLLNILDSKQGRSDPGSAVCLQHYAQHRQLDILAVSAFTEGLLASFSPGCSSAKWARSLAMKLLHQGSPLKHLLLSHAAGTAQTSE